LSETVVAVHKLTGLIGEVPEHLLEIFPELEKATEKQIKSAHNKAETEIYGAPLKDGIIPGDVAVAPASATDGGTAANG
jgi:hypothetical protein